MTNLLGFSSLIQKYIQKYLNQKVNLTELITDLFAEDVINQNAINQIRRYTLIGEIGNSILAQLSSQEKIEIKAIGDIHLSPDFFDQREKIIKNSFQKIDFKSLIGYDLTGQGESIFREKITKYMNIFYNFQHLNYQDIINNIVFTYGGTDAFVLILDTLKHIYPDKQLKLIYPEASFPANIEIAKLKLGADNLISIFKPDISNFFISINDINKLYLKGGDKNSLNIFYITPVGNPTGYKIDAQELYNICTYIHQLDPNALFVFDNVYISLLLASISQELFQKLFHHSTLCNKMIIIESLSKTLGFTGIRIGWFWGTDNNLFTKIKKITGLQRAGYSKLHTQLVDNLLTDTTLLLKFQNNLYNYWSENRLNFIKLIKEKFSHLFEIDQSCPIKAREGIYIFLKLKNKISPIEVTAQLKIIGVPIQLSDGWYIRYAFGN